MAPRMYTKAAAVVAPNLQPVGLLRRSPRGLHLRDHTSVNTTGFAPFNTGNVVGGARSASVGLDRDGYGGQIGWYWQANRP